MIAQARTQNRGADLEKLVRHLQSVPDSVSRLASLLMLIDEDFRGPLKAEIDAYRRFGRQKSREITDDEVLDAMLAVFDRGVG